MDDYIRGVLCGYLIVQSGDHSKQKRMFVVLSESRMDYYLTDPRPAFDQDIADAYIFSASTQVHHYEDLNPKAPPNSICLTTDKTTDVYIAESHQEAELWFYHIQERLEGLATMVTGSLMLRKELGANQQLKRFVLKSKYRWEKRYIELGRATLRFCKESERKVKIMKQFMLTPESYAGEEGIEFLKKLSVIASYSIPVVLNPKLVKKLKKQGEDALANSSISRSYPFSVTSGPSHLFLAASSESERSDWITAIRMRIIALKHRSKRSKDQLLINPSYHLQAFMNVQAKPGSEWKKRYVELDNDILRIKRSEQTIGSLFETTLVPTCHLLPALLKANAFVVRNLGREVALAPSTAKESEQWMNTIRAATRAVTIPRCERIFQESAQSLLCNSVIYTLNLAAGEMAGLVVEKYKKRIFVLSHERPMAKPLKRMSIAAALSKKMASTDNASPSILPRGSVLVAIEECDIVHDSFENIWHRLRQKKGPRHPMKLTFRAPSMKDGVVHVRFHPRARWELQRCRLQFGLFRVEALDDKTQVMLTIPLRECQVELFSDEHCANGIKLTVNKGNVNNKGSPITIWMNVSLDADAMLWYTLLHLEAAIGQDDLRFPLSLTVLNNTKSKRLLAPLPSEYAEHLKKAYNDCFVMGIRIPDIESSAQMRETMLINQKARAEAEYVNATEPTTGGIKPDDIHLSHTQTQPVGLSESDMSLFFQHLDVIGCGKVFTSSLLFTIGIITRHIDLADKLDPRYNNILHQEDSLSSLRLALDQLNANKVGSLNTIIQNEFEVVMRAITHPEVVELVQKLSQHSILYM